MKPHCKDQAFARQLINQMNFGEVGRKPSTYRDAQSPKYDVPEAGKKWTQPKVRGGWIRYRWEDCEVGDCVLDTDANFSTWTPLHDTWKFKEDSVFIVNSLKRFWVRIA